MSTTQNVKPITEADIAFIKELRKQGVPVSAIAERLGFNRKRIARAIQGKSYNPAGCYDRPRVTKDSEGAEVYRHCMICKGPLPCLECARKLRRELGLVGKEPPDMTAVLELSPDEAEAVRRIREDGFYDDSSGEIRPPWDDETYYKRAGIDPGPMEAVPVPLLRHDVDLAKRVV
jgi:hypothetical protein